MLDRLNGFWTRLGIKPAVANIFVTGLVYIAYTWITTGAFDGTELRLLVANFILGAAGVASPPEPGSIMTRAGVKPRR